MQSEPILDVAHLGHVELLTNKPEASLHFFVDILGLSESGRDGDSVYLRAFDDYEFHSLKLTAAKRPAFGTPPIERSVRRRFSAGSARSKN